jgi:hypothetical protein
LKTYRIAAIFLLPAFFWFFHRGVLSAHFGPDEPMNLYSYWQPSLGKIVQANVFFWSHFTRPGAALYYLPLYRVFGLNVVPYNFVRNLLLLVNTGLFYLLAFRLLRSRWVALLAALPIAYHANLGYLAWGGAFIYDVLCRHVLLRGLVVLPPVQKSGATRNPADLCLSCALYLCAGCEGDGGEFACVGAGV